MTTPQKSQSEEMAALSDADIAQILAQPVALLSPHSPSRQLSHTFRIDGRYRTLRVYLWCCVAATLAGIPLEILEPRAFPFVAGRALAALAMLAGAHILQRRRTILTEAFALAGPILLALLMAGVLSLRFGADCFQHRVFAALMLALAGLGTLQIDLLTVFAVSALLSILTAALALAAPLPVADRLDLILATAAGLATVGYFRWVTMIYRCHNIHQYFRAEIQRRALATLSAKLKVSAETDQLTGVGNRRHFEDLCRALQDGATAGVLMIDIDRFKALNDTLGHGEGDRCLQAVAQAIRGALRDADAVSRYGGEEFVVLIENPPDGTLRPLAERIRAAVETNVRSGIGRVTVSIGVASGPAATFEAVITAADRALYRAKGLGRNRVEGEEPNPTVLLAAG